MNILAKSTKKQRYTRTGAYPCRNGQKKSYLGGVINQAAKKLRGVQYGGDCHEAVVRKVNLQYFLLRRCKYSGSWRKKQAFWNFF